MASPLSASFSLSMRFLFPLRYLTWLRPMPNFSWVPKIAVRIGAVRHLLLLLCERICHPLRPPCDDEDTIEKRGPKTPNFRLRLGVAVADDPSDKAHQPVLRDVVEELLEVDVDDPYVAVVEILQGLHNGVLTSPSRPEAVGAVAEDGFEDGGEHL